jgi:hypothetical protein
MDKEKNSERKNLYVSTTIMPFVNFWPVTVSNGRLDLVICTEQWTGYRNKMNVLPLPPHMWPICQFCMISISQIYLFMEPFWAWSMEMETKTFLNNNTKKKVAETCFHTKSTGHVMPKFCIIYSSLLLSCLCSVKLNAQQLSPPPPSFVTTHSSVENTLHLGEYQRCLRTRMETVLLSSHGPIIQQNTVWDTLCYVFTNQNLTYVFIITDD